jgi:hypothetical protein
VKTVSGLAAKSALFHWGSMAQRDYLPFTQRRSIAMQRRDFGRLLMLAAGGAFTMATSRLAQAAQPPMAESEIAESSDAVIVADVVGVACQEESREIPRYAAWVQIREVLKGDQFLAPNQMINLEFCRLMGPQTAGVEVLLFAGERVRLCLNQDNLGYQIWHQDGKRTLIPVSPANRRLPQGTGAIILGDQSLMSRRRNVRR